MERGRELLPSPPAKGQIVSRACEVIHHLSTNGTHPFSRLQKETCSSTETEVTVLHGTILKCGGKAEKTREPSVRRGVYLPDIRICNFKLLPLLRISQDWHKIGLRKWTCNHNERCPTSVTEIPQSCKINAVLASLLSLQNSSKYFCTSRLSG
jgi:hypothetical protein